MPFNPYNRRPIALATYRNRRVTRPAPTPIPTNRNVKLVVLRSWKLDDVVALLVLALISVSVGLGMVVGAIRIMQRTPDTGLEFLLGFIGVPLVALGVCFVYKASLAWKECTDLDDKLDRQRQALASVIQRPSSDKLELPSNNWLQ